MFCKNQQLEREATAGQNQKNIKHKNKINVQFKKKQLNQKLTQPTTQNKKFKNCETYGSTSNLPAALYFEKHEFM